MVGAGSRNANLASSVDLDEEITLCLQCLYYETNIDRLTLRCSWFADVRPSADDECYNGAMGFEYDQVAFDG